MWIQSGLGATGVADRVRRACELTGRGKRDEDRVRIRTIGISAQDHTDPYKIHAIHTTPNNATQIHAQRRNPHEPWGKHAASEAAAVSIH